jgi:hypothetical protein
MGKNDNKTDVKEEMESRLKVEHVVVKYGGTSGWAISYPGKGIKEIRPDSTEKFNPHDRYELHALLQIIKQVNTPRVNRQQYMDKADQVNPYKVRYKFELVSGHTSLPPALQKLKYGPSDFPTDEVREAILSLCPDYWEEKEKRR